VVSWLKLPAKVGHSASGASALTVACAVLAVTIAVTSSAGAASGMPDAPPQRAHAAIIGGQPAQPGTFPWMAYVLDFKGDSAEQCSGTVVAPNLVLTAGHCAEDVQSGAVNEAAGYQVTTGNVDWAAPQAERQVSGVSRVIVCGCFDRDTTVGDVALLQLSTPTSAPAIALAARPPAGTAALLAGWGETHVGQATPVERLQWANTLVQSPQSCEREATPFNPQGEICTIDAPARQTGACFGDSGGPLLVSEPSAIGGMVQIGVASHVYDECTTTSPSVFTRVDAVAAWVRGWAQTLAEEPSASASLSISPVAAPALTGVASGRSLTLSGSAISLVLACDSEGGVCNGEAEAKVHLREEHIARLDGRQTVSTRGLEVTLASVDFSIAPGASVTVHPRLSSENRTLLSDLGNGPLDVMLTGRGVIHRVIRLEPAGRS
jgi:secreted trypsin-like serine protease